MTQVCLNVGGARYETRLKTLLKGAEQGSEVLAGICQTLTTQHQNYSVSESVCLLILIRTADGIQNTSPLPLPERRSALEAVNSTARPCLRLILLAGECVTLTLKVGMPEQHALDMLQVTSTSGSTSHECTSTRYILPGLSRPGDTRLPLQMSERSAVDAFPAPQVDTSVT